MGGPLKHWNEEPAPFAIGHVARLIGVSPSTLRLWEEHGLLQPAKSPSGRRTYSERTIERARRIQQLRLVSGLGIDAIQQMFAAEDAGAGGAAVAPPAEPTSTAIGTRVRSLRRDAQMTLEALSRKTDIATSHLSMFERGVAHLSPARLAAVAAAFDCSLADLLGGTLTRNTHVVRKGGGRIVGSFGPGVRIEQLTVAQRLMDAEVWTIDAGQGSDGFYYHKGEELVFVLEGELEVTLSGSEPEVLGPGDSAFFSSTLRHRWRNPGSASAVVLWVNTDTERLAAMSFERAGNRLPLGASSTLGAGESGLSVALAAGAQTYRVIETHTAGHPTRILIEPLAGLSGATVLDKVAQFRERHDALRPLLLHEPRGHAGSFGLIPTSSDKADFGAFFVSSHGYPKMCGHAIIGYAAALRALGRLDPRQGFTIEIPAGVFEVTPERAPGQVGLHLPRNHVAAPDIPVMANGREGHACLAYGGELYAIVEAADFGLELEPGQLRRLLEAGMEIRSSPALATALDNMPELGPLAAVLWVAPQDGGIERQFVAIDARKYDRSPGVIGLAVRMAQKCHRGQLGAGDAAKVESVFGGRLEGRVLELNSSNDGAPPSCSVVVTGRAHLHGVSTLIHEADDPMGGGFLG
jgi:proline racemase/DNA-binding transcriptional MerR regulator/quercetin dioxygenase-like cupin family protein